MLDRDLILRKLSELDQYITQASEYRHLTAEQYSNDWRTQRIIERTLQMAVDTCMDVATHAIADRALPVPTTYAEAFEVLGRAGLIDDRLRETMVRMAKFRNVIVHEYARIDPDIVVRILRDHLDDLRQFKAAALGWR